MKEIVKDLKGATVLAEAAIKKLEKCKQQLANRETNVDLQGLEDVCNLIESAIFDLEEALDEIPYVTGEK